MRTARITHCTTPGCDGVAFREGGYCPKCSAERNCEYQREYHRRNTPEYYCIEPGCNNRAIRANQRCHDCSVKRHRLMNTVAGQTLRAAKPKSHDNRAAIIEEDRKAKELGLSYGQYGVMKHMK